MGETSENGLVRAALDDICRMAARTTRSDIACIVTGIDDTHASVCGAVGTNVVFLDGTVLIPSLGRRPLLVWPELKNSGWFHEHALASIAPFASSLIIVLIDDKPTLQPCYLALFNPRASYLKDTSTLASLSELSRIASTLLSHGHAEFHAEALSEKANSLLSDVHSGLEENPHSLALNFDNLPSEINNSSRVKYSSEDPLMLFLNRSLIKRRLLSSRKGSAFVTLRTWRKTAKDTQIDALKSLKLERSPRAIHSVASEMVAAIEELYAGIQFSAVIPVPGGHSGHENSFSVLLAKEIAQLLSLPFASPLVGKLKKGSSHPKESATLPAYDVQEKVNGSVLLIDDVVTSGVHMEKAITALKKAGAFPLAIAWIGR